MKRYFIIFIIGITIVAICVMLNACVKDPQSEIDIDKATEFTLDGKTDLILYANPEKMYKVVFRVTDNAYSIENDQNITFSVSHGTLISPSDLTKEENSITAKIKNKKAEVFYRPADAASDNIELVAFVDPFTITKQLKTLPVMPDRVAFEYRTYYVNKSTPVDVIAFLKTDSSKVSSGLNVDFLYEPTLSLINITPRAAKSQQTTTDSFTKAATRIENISALADTVMIKVRFRNVVMDSTVIYFHD